MNTVMVELKDKAFMIVGDKFYLRQGYWEITDRDKLVGAYREDLVQAIYLNTRPKPDAKTIEKMMRENKMILEQCMWEK